MNRMASQLLYAYRNRRIRYSVIAVIILSIVVVFAARRRTPGEEGSWARAERGDFIIELIESGEIRAVDSIFVTAPREWSMDLQIIELVPEGSFVKKGDFLIRFDSSSLEDELATAEDNLKQAEADLLSIETQQASRMSEMETNLQIAEYSREAARIKLDLLEFESEMRKEDARLDLEKELIRYDETVTKKETQKIIDATEHQKSSIRVEQAKAILASMRRRIEQLTLYAPISGMVVYQEIGGMNTSRYKAAIGDNAMPGQPVVSIPDLSSMKMVAQVNEMDVGSLKKGQRVELRLDAFENSVYHGTLSDVASLVEKIEEWWRPQPTTKAPSFQVTILIDEQNSMLKPGMTARGCIVIEEIPDVLTVPIGAVFESDDGSTVVFTRSSFPDPVPVRQGKRNDRCAIIEEGLREGDEVALVPPSDRFHPLGWFAEMERRKVELTELISHIDRMNALGITPGAANADSAGRGTEENGELRTLPPPSNVPIMRSEQRPG